MSASKAKGTAAETAVLRYVRDNGFPWAHRLALTGNADQGDISLLPGNLVIVEVKSHATAATGQPGDAFHNHRVTGLWLMMNSISFLFPN